MRKAIGYITGVGITKFGELYDYSLEDLILESAVEALRDSRLKNMAEIDLVVISSMTSSYLGNQGHLSSLATQVLGTECPVISVDAACGGGASALGVVLSWLGSKNVSTALVIGVEKLTDCSAEKVAEGMMLASSYREEAIHGFTFTALAALVARRYFHEYRVDPKVLAKIAVKN
ncbi:hypothetical protein KKB40_01025, partial [Patescibacteria group bacterium]|nr:hypothetical protein [Patescibacteria group bacterium]